MVGRGKGKARIGEERDTKDGVGDWISLRGLLGFHIVACSLVWGVERLARSEGKHIVGYLGTGWNRSKHWRWKLPMPDLILSGARVPNGALPVVV